MKKKDFDKNKVFSRRSLILGTAQASLAFIVIARLGYLQLFKHKKYSIESDNNRIRSLIKPAPRGIIYDRNNRILAKNDGNYRLLFYTRNKKDAKAILRIVVDTLELNNEAYESFLVKIQNASRRSIISLADNLSFDDVTRIETESYRLQGISTESGLIRNYTFPYETAHIIGYVSLPSEREIDDNDQNLFMNPEFRVGKTGLEKTFDETLRGDYGVKKVEVNAFSVPIRTISTESSTKGLDLNLTLDIDVQKFTLNRVKDDVASVVVIDVKTGEILSCVSSPSFNSNNFVEGISREYWGSLSTDLKRPLNNKPIGAIYPPGSTFKLVVALAALKDLANPKQIVYCPGHFKYGNRIAHCWKKEGHGRVDMLQALEQSCNVYFFTLGIRLGVAKIAEMAKKFGYGEKFNIGIKGVLSGNIPTTEWKKKVFNQSWSGGDNLNTAIGQGFVLASPLQMAVVTARLANGGIPIDPYLVKNKITTSQFQDLSSKVLAPKEHIDLVLEGMNRVVNSQKGTAFFRRIEEKGFEMAGKTGTSQVISKREDLMTDSERALNINQNHAIFVGFAPVANPKYAISVVVEHGKSGSGAAAPIGKDVLTYIQSNA